MSRVLYTVNSYNIIEDEDCGYFRCDPLPTDEELSDYYQRVFYTSRKPDYFERQKQDEEWWNLVFQGRLERCAALRDGPIERVLDIGCGPGLFLKYCQDQGMDVIGLEPSEDAADFARQSGVQVISGGYENFSSADLGTFDLIYSNGVLEHLPDPLSFLETCRDGLGENGQCFVSVSNDFNPIQQIWLKMGQEPWWLCPPEHINYFSPDSLSALVVKAGLSPQSVTTTFPIDLFLLMGENYLGNEDVGRVCHQRRKTFELGLAAIGESDFKDQLYEKFAELGIGREVDLVAGKT